MHLIAFATNFRNFDNYADAFRLVRERGGECELVALPWTGDPSHERLAHTGFPLRLHRPISALSEDGISLQDLEEIVRGIVAAAPDFVMLCDMQSYPSNRVHGLLKKHGFRGRCIGLQHGLFQLWNLYNDNFCADYLFCFGRRHVEQIHPGNRAKAFAVGLPKMDRLAKAEVKSGGYILFLPQRSPEAVILDPALAVYEQAMQIPVVVHDHPQYPSLCRHRSALPLPEVLRNTTGWSVIDYIRHAEMVITLHSTAALEAMYLGKPVVLLPNAGLGAFENYPGISEGFSPQAINVALQNVMRPNHHTQAWLDHVMGGWRHDHAERVYAKLCELHAAMPDRPSLEFTADQAPWPLLTTREQLVKLVPAGGAAAELGVAKGHFSNELLKAGDHFKLYSVDRWAGDRGHDDVQYNEARALLSKHGERSIVIKKTFEDCLADFPEESLDLVYIDGYAHTGQDGGKTLEQWWSRVRPGGIFAGHDYHPKWQPTIDAVNAFAHGHGLRINLTTDDEYPSWFVRKPKAAQLDLGEAAFPAGRSHSLSAIS